MNRISGEKEIGAWTAWMAERRAGYTDDQLLHLDCIDAFDIDSSRPEADLIWAIACELLAAGAGRKGER